MVGYSSSQFELINPSTMAAKQRERMFQLTFFTVFVLLNIAVCIADTKPTRQAIERGFTERHDASYTEFQPLLSDPTGEFSLGFLRVNTTLLDLAVIHLPSSFPLWRAVVATPTLSTWTGTTSLSFNGSLVLFDNSSSQPNVLWSTDNIVTGDQLLLLNTSNLQIHKEESVLWQSFDFPSDTLVLSQNFNSSAVLLSRNHNFTMRLGSNYLALYMEQESELTQRASRNSVMYWKYAALDPKSLIADGGGEIYARINDTGFLGLYQSSVQVDLIPFNSFTRGISKFRRLTVENTGNLRAYYWNDTVWLLDFEAIREPCGLPTVCGAYGLCFVSETGEQSCGCLLSSDSTSSDDGQQQQCSSAVGMGSGNDLCEERKGKYEVVRRQGVDLSIEKELVAYQKVASMMDCEATCENNCSCWGAVYNNATGFCYQIDYPIRTLVEADHRKLAYLKVVTTAANSSSNNSNKSGHAVKLALLVLAVGMLVGCAMFGAYRAWQWRRQRREDENDDQASSLPYKNLSSASFRSIELSSTSK